MLQRENAVGQPAEVLIELNVEVFRIGGRLQSARLCQTSSVRIAVGPDFLVIMDLSAYRANLLKEPDSSEPIRIAFESPM